VKCLRKRLTFSIAFSVCLIVTIAAAILAQGQPAQTCETTAQDIPQDLPSGSVVDYGNGAIVALQLPPVGGNMTHPVNLRLMVTDIYGSSEGDIPAAGIDVIQVFVWVPAMNQYVGVAILTTNTNQTAIERVESIVNGTPIWNPPTMMNFFVPTADQLQVYMDNDDVLFVNLTTSVNITLPAALGGNFTLPPMTLMFRPIAPGFAHNETAVLPKPPYSGYTMQLMHTDVPAWVRATIPMWLANAPVETVGTMMLDGVAIYIPPSS
jgi:hypothetical protein